MKQDKLNYYYQKLKAEKRQLIYGLKRFSDEEFASFKDSIGELSSYDNHPADQGSETYERGKDIGIRDNLISLLKQVDDALDKIKAGKYGMCQACKQEIPKERLEAVPYSSFCKECKEKEENIESIRTRPLAEDTFAPAFGRGFNDNTNKNEYDAEDAWQDVAQYGTSNTAQDEVGETTAKSAEESYTDSEEKIGVVGKEDEIIADEESNLRGEIGNAKK